MNIVEVVEKVLGTTLGSWHREFVTELYKGLKAG